MNYGLKKRTGECPLTTGRGVATSARAVLSWGRDTACSALGPAQLSAPHRAPVWDTVLFHLPFWTLKGEKQCRKKDRREDKVFYVQETKLRLGPPLIHKFQFLIDDKAWLARTQGVDTLHDCWLTQLAG